MNERTAVRELLDGTKRTLLRGTENWHSVGGRGIERSAHDAEAVLCHPPSPPDDALGGEGGQAEDTRPVL